MEETQNYSIGKTINFINKSNNENPTYADDGSSGFDLRAYITVDNGGTFNFLTNTYEVLLKPLQRMMIHTGIYFDVPDSNGYTGAICTVGGDPGTWKRFGKIS